MSGFSWLFPIAFHWGSLIHPTNKDKSYLNCWILVCQPLSESLYNFSPLFISNNKMVSQTVETIAFPLWMDRRQKVDNSLTGKYFTLFCHWKALGTLLSFESGVGVRFQLGNFLFKKSISYILSHDFEIVRVIRT